MKRAPILAVAILLAVGLSAIGSPAAAKPAEIDVEFLCGSILITSSKDISNVVYSTGGGEVLKLEGPFPREIELDFEGIDSVEAVWVKAGDNHSGDGPGYGERFLRPPDCICDPECDVEALFGIEAVMVCVDGCDPFYPSDSAECPAPYIRSCTLIGADLMCYCVDLATATCTNPLP